MSAVLSRTWATGAYPGIAGGAAVRGRLAARWDELLLSGHSTEQGDEGYSPEMFVLTRVLEFPFERYPLYCYPVRMVLWPTEHMRWDIVEQVIRFAELLNQPKGSRAGQPIRLLGFQVLIIMCIFGPHDPETSRRAVREVVMTIARKNGKTALVGMMMLAMMSLGAFDLRAQDMQVGASDREQASLTFVIMQNLVLLDREMGLEKLYSVIPSAHRIVNKKSYSKLKCLSSDAYRAHGADPVCVLMDELGNLPDPKAREFYGVLSTAFGSQLEPLMLMFSTQAPADSHLFSENVDAAKAANPTEDGGEDPTSIGFVFDLPLVDDGTGLKLLGKPKKGRLQEVDPYAEENWFRANPALEGVSPHGFRSLADMRARKAKALKMPSIANNFRNLNLNQRISAITPFISREIWEASLASSRPDEDLMSGALVAAGDLSVTTDLSAVAYMWRLPDGKYHARIQAYTPQENLKERAKTSKVPYDYWVEQGYLKATEGRVIDYAVIAEDMRDMDEAFSIEKMGFDRYKWDRVKKECQSIGFEPYEAEPGEFWVPIGQGFLGAEPCVAALEMMLLKGVLEVEANPVSTWCASNAVVAHDPSKNRKFERAKSYGKIDCVVALAMAAYLATEGDLDDRIDTGGYDSGSDLLVL